MSFLSTQTITLRTPGAIAMLLVILGIVGITGVIRCAHADTNDTFPSAQSGVRYTQADPDSQEAEETFWDAVKDSGDADLIEAYLQSFPDGAFVVQARAKLAELGGGAAPAPAGHPFFGTWGFWKIGCDKIVELKGSDRSGLEIFVVFGAGNATEYYSNGRRFFRCSAPTIIEQDNGFSLSAQCTEPFSLVGRPQTGSLVLRTGILATGSAGLLGRGPDGNRLAFSARCD